MNVSMLYISEISLYLMSHHLVSLNLLSDILESGNETFTAIV